MNNNPRIRASIIIPHLNQISSLEKCLSVLSPQIFRAGGVEIIVVDNGSTQLPADICARFPSVNLIQEQRPGPGPARNRGISESSGPILAFIDSDCVPRENWLEVILSAFDSDMNLQVAGGDVKIDLVDPAKPTLIEAYESVFGYRQQEYIEKQNFSGTGNLAMRREIFDLVGPFASVEVAEDRDWGHRAAAKGCRIKYIREMIVFHPARRSFAELRTKWDRHIIHDANESQFGALGKLKWIGLAFAVSVSGFFDIRKILISERLPGAAARFKASIVLVRIRLYRGWRMFQLLLSRDMGKKPTWNKT
jgi:glycosyltransferase involved in cell wall biosynthesis